MRHSIIILTLFVSIFAHGQNPLQPPQETTDAMQKISFLTGNWKGTGWIQMEPQKYAFNQTEAITAKVNGTLIQIDGQGKNQLNPDVIIFQTFAVISFDPKDSKYLMKAYGGDGVQVDASAKLIDGHTFQWIFSNPMAGQIQFTITVQNNKWKEVGEISRDNGTTWNKYFEMTLDKQ